MWIQKFVGRSCGRTTYLKLVVLGHVSDELQLSQVLLHNAVIPFYYSPVQAALEAECLTLSLEVFARVRVFADVTSCTKCTRVNNIFRREKRKS
jgi:hypothetical protein